MQHEYNLPSGYSLTYETVSSILGIIDGSSIIEMREEFQLFYDGDQIDGDLQNLFLFPDEDDLVE